MNNQTSSNNGTFPWTKEINQNTKVQLFTQTINSNKNAFIPFFSCLQEMNADSCSSKVKIFLFLNKQIELLEEVNI